MLDHAAVRRQGAAEDREARLGAQGIRARADDVVVEDLRAREVLGDRSPVHRHGVVQVQPRHQAAQPAGLEEVLHQVFPARSDVRQDGDAAGELVEAVQRQGNAGTAGHRDQVDDRVRGPAQGQHDADRVLERLDGQR